MLKSVQVTGRAFAHHEGASSERLNSEDSGSEQSPTLETLENIPDKAIIGLFHKDGVKELGYNLQESVHQEYNKLKG